MKIQITPLVEDGIECQVVDWGDINTIEIVLLTKTNHYPGESYKFERGKDDPQFYTQGEMEFLGEQLIASEKRAADMFSVINTAAETVKVIMR